MTATVIANLIVVLLAAIESCEYKSLQAALKMARSKGVELQVKLNAKKPAVLAEAKRIVAAYNEQEPSEPVLQPIAANVIATVAAVVEQVVEETKVDEPKVEVKQEESNEKTYDQGVLYGIKLSQTKVAALEAKIAELQAELAALQGTAKVEPKVEAVEEPVVAEVVDEVLEYELVAGCVDEDGAEGINFTDEEIDKANAMIEVAQEISMEHGLEGFVPFFYLRKAMGDLSRQQQDRVIYCMQYLGAELHTIHETLVYTAEQMEAGIPSVICGDLFFVEV